MNKMILEIKFLLLVLNNDLSMLLEVISKSIIVLRATYQLLYGGHLYNFLIFMMSVSLRLTFLPKLVWLYEEDFGMIVSFGSSPNGFFENALSE